MKIGFKKLITNLIYPPRCVFCQKRMPVNTRFEVCSDCANALPYTKVYTRCKKCGKPMAQNGLSQCSRCNFNKSYVTRTTSAFVYTDMAKRTTVAFKKERNAHYAKVLAVYVAEMVKYDFKGIDFDCVVSVPPRKKAFTDEKFDQAGLLAKEVALRLSLPYFPNAMQQSRSIRKQSSLSYNDRVNNVKGAFNVRKPEKIANKNILLIDDVCTSGSTLNECAKTLKESGAYRVFAATLTTVPSV